MATIGNTFKSFNGGDLITVSDGTKLSSAPVLVSGQFSAPSGINFANTTCILKFNKELAGSVSLLSLWAFCFTDLVTIPDANAIIEGKNVIFRTAFTAGIPCSVSTNKALVTYNGTALKGINDVVVATFADIEIDAIEPS